MQALARILRNGSALGAGFLISDRYLCTCAHVVNLVRGLDPYRQDGPDPDLPIDLDFPNLRASNDACESLRGTATVVRWQAPTPAGRQPGPQDDCAVLRLAHPLGAASVPRFAGPRDAVAADTRIRAWGTPQGEKDGVWARGVLAPAVGTLWQTDDAGSIRPGFSGGPATDDGLRVLGMVVQVNAARDTAWLLPFAALYPIFESLRVVTLDLGLTAGRLHAPGADPATGTPLADLARTVAAGDLRALHRALAKVVAPTALPLEDALAAVASLDHLALGPRRLRLRCQGAVAGLPWHCLTDQTGTRLGTLGWIIEVLGPDPRPLLEFSIHHALILAPGDSRLAPGVRPHVDQVSAALAPLLRYPRLRQVPWALNAHDLERLVGDGPDLVYVYARVTRQGGLALGSDWPGEEFGVKALTDALAALHRPPILWLHCIETPEARLDLDRLLAVTRDYPLLLIQRTDDAHCAASLHHRTLAWLADLAATSGTGALEPAAVLSRAGDPGTCARLGQEGLRLTRPVDLNAVLYEFIHAALIQVLLGRTSEKDLVKGRIRARGKTLVLYFVCGEAKARVHDFPEQCHWHLEADEDPPLVRPTLLPATLSTDQDAAELRRLLFETLQVDRDSALAREGLEKLARSRLGPRKAGDAGAVRASLETIVDPAPLPDETLVFSLPWLLTPAPGCTRGQALEWLGRWKTLVLDTFQADEIPPGMRVLTGCCVQWDAPAPDRGSADSPAADPLALQKAAADLLRPGNPSHCDSVQIKTPLDRLEREDIEDFFHDQGARLELFTKGLDHEAMVAWVWSRANQGVFDDTVRAIYDGCLNGFSAQSPTPSPGVPA